MEKSSSHQSIDDSKLVSCWDRFKLKLPWRRRKGSNTTRKRSVGRNIITAFKTKPPKPGGGFRYDPLSYSQNFDDGRLDDDDDDSSYRGFSSRIRCPFNKIA
ncbi:hypothetical protein L1049_026000 [Liquidambar formosana]|uniref:Uncharacterized protein n=1 Tax=Liquidambar formosana TaxID=63359 RepID=A0AAP0R8S8_LIQFO